MDAVDEAIDKLLADRRRLMAECEKLTIERDDAKATAEHWIGKAERADQAAADLKAELEDTRRRWKEELAAERALAEELAEQFPLRLFDTTLDEWREARSE